MTTGSIPWPSIPDETPIDDLSGLKAPDVRDRIRLNEVEAENIRKAMVQYLGEKPTAKRAPFTLAWCKQLHEEMFGEVWDWAGQCRQTDVTNFGSKPFVIEQDLQALLDDLRAWESSSMSLMEQAARLHHRAVSIHPFKNGNGRWARMLANVWLLQHSERVIFWPEETIGSMSTGRNAYLRALKRADDGDIGALVSYQDRHAEAFG